MFAVTGCYNDFDAPKPAKVYTDEDFAGMKHISIAEVKQMFLDEHKSRSAVRAATRAGAIRSTYRSASRPTGWITIKGQGKVERRKGGQHKSLYLVDDSGAIEVKLHYGGSILPIRWGVSTRPRVRSHRTGSMSRSRVSISATYRMMLSLGEGLPIPTTRWANINSMPTRTSKTRRRSAKRVFLGEETQLELARRSSEVTEANCDDFFGQNGQQFSGVW